MDSGYSTTSAGTASIIDGLGSDRESFRLNLAEDAFQTTRYTKVKVVFASQFTTADFTGSGSLVMLGKWQFSWRIHLMILIILFPRFFILITEHCVADPFKGTPPPASSCRDQFAVKYNMVYTTHGAFTWFSLQGESGLKLKIGLNVFTGVYTSFGNCDAQLLCV